MAGHKRVKRSQREEDFRACVALCFILIQYRTILEEVYNIKTLGDDELDIFIL